MDQFPAEQISVERQMQMYDDKVTEDIDSCQLREEQANVQTSGDVVEQQAPPLFGWKAIANMSEKTLQQGRSREFEFETLFSQTLLQERSQKVETLPSCALQQDRSNESNMPLLTENNDDLALNKISNDSDDLKTRNTTSESRVSQQIEKMNSNEQNMFDGTLNPLTEPNLFGVLHTPSGPIPRVETLNPYYRPDTFVGIVNTHSRLIPHIEISNSSSGPHPYVGIANPHSRPNPYVGIVNPQTVPNPYVGIANPHSRPNPYVGIANPHSRPNPYVGIANPQTVPNPYIGIANPHSRPNPYVGIANPQTVPNPYVEIANLDSRPNLHAGLIINPHSGPNPFVGIVNPDSRPNPHAGKINSHNGPNATIMSPQNGQNVEISNPPSIPNPHAGILNSASGTHMFVGILSPECTIDSNLDSDELQNSNSDEMENNENRDVINKPFSYHNAAVMKAWVYDFITHIHKPEVKMSKLRSYLRETFKTVYGIKMASLKREVLSRVLEDFKDKVIVEGRKIRILALKNNVGILKPDCTSDSKPITSSGRKFMAEMGNLECISDITLDSDEFQESNSDKSDMDVRAVVTNKPFSHENTGVMKAWVDDFIADIQETEVKMSKLQSYLSKTFKTVYGIKMASLKKEVLLTVLEDFKDKVIVKDTKDPTLVLQKIDQNDFKKIVQIKKLSGAMPPLSECRKLPNAFLHSTPDSELDINKDYNSMIKKESLRHVSSPDITPSDEELRKNASLKVETRNMIKNSIPQPNNPRMSVPNAYGALPTVPMPLLQPGPLMLMPRMMNMQYVQRLGQSGIGQFGYMPSDERISSPESINNRSSLGQFGVGQFGKRSLADPNFNAQQINNRSIHGNIGVGLSGNVPLPDPNTEAQQINNRSLLGEFRDGPLGNSPFAGPNTYPQLINKQPISGVNQFGNSAINSISHPRPINNRLLLGKSEAGQYGNLPSAGPIASPELMNNQILDSPLTKAPLPSLRGDVVNIVSRPIDNKEFETKLIHMPSVFVPNGQCPSQELVNNVAKECIEFLADANELVSLEKVENLVCQRLNCINLQQTGFQYVEKIPCVNEMVRLICKINAYIIAFVKTRSICTLYELRKELKEYEPYQEEFTNLTVGPLQKLQVIFCQFRFPPNQAMIPPITSMDILDHLNNYLTRYQLWSKKLDLAPFMSYLVEQYSADDAYMLGVRIRSLPLAYAVLNKALRDAASNKLEIIAHFRQNLKKDIEETFRKFKTSTLQAEKGRGMTMQTHYLKLQPELTVTEVFEKFKLLMMCIQLHKYKQQHVQKLSRAIHEFISCVKEDELAQSLLHLAICTTNTMLEESAMKLLSPMKQVNDGFDGRQTSSILPPIKGLLVDSLKKYIEQYQNAGALSLTLLAKIERILPEVFGFPEFDMMGYGRFLEFMLTEAKQLLEEGGLTIGSDNSVDDVSCKPHQSDVFEFIRQCQLCGLTQLTEIENALCKTFKVNNVCLLGFGTVACLVGNANKLSSNTVNDYNVFYEAALVPAVGSEFKVEIPGHQIKEVAKVCLHNCPLLEDLAKWSQWGLVFEPELGKLKDFIHKYGGEKTKPIEGGQLVTLDFMALELKPGVLLKIVSSTSPEHVAKTLEQRDVIGTSGHLVSTAVSYHGSKNLPVALLSGHVKTALLQMHAHESEQDQNDQNVAVLFVLQCLLRIPTRLCVALANQFFLEPLAQVVGSTKSKQLLPQLCKTVKELNHLIELGCLLGIQEWTNLTQQKCVPPHSAVLIVTPDVEEHLPVDNLDQKYEVEAESANCTDIDDVDVISSNDNIAQIIDKIQVEDIEERDENVVMLADINGSGSTVDKIVLMDNASESENVMPSCEDIVNQICKDEFGVGVHLSEDGHRLMKVQQERLGRSLDRLSKDLYSKDTHFVLELIQNADDNSYHGDLLNNTNGECPSVKFIIDAESIQVMNNELGFQERDIRALCDVGKSTKGKHKFGYIGQKGIGFKSVFRVTDVPEVHSNGYHIKFDVNSGPMGYIQPHWIPESEQPNNNSWMTQIVLKLKNDMRVQSRTLAARFNDIHPSLLLFLHRLRQITIENKVENSVQTMRRNDISENIIEIQDSDVSERWLVVKKTLDASKISIQVKSGADVECTEIALAFPIKSQAQATHMQALPPKQPVFAFLPLRSYGFRFIVQGDFDVPSSREDVDRDSPWNQWLRNEIHILFLDSLEIFKSHTEFTDIEAVCHFLQFVPMEDEVLDFFKPVSSDILKRLKARPCVPTQPNNEGIISWKMPSQTVRVRDPLVRTVITSDLLQMHLNLYYLHSDVAAILNPTLTSCFGIESLTSEHLYQLGHALIVQIGTHCDCDDDVILIAKWLACMYRSLDEFHHEDTILTKLKLLQMLPLSDGELVSLHDRTVFYPITDSVVHKQGQKGPVYYLQKDINSLHPMLLTTGDDEVNSQVSKLLLRLGIKQLSPFDVIHHHIIPVLKSDSWKKKSELTLISYLIYIKEQTEKQASVCNLDEFKDIAMVKTNQGFKIPSREPVHFPHHYGNQINLQHIFCGYAWTLLDPLYMPVHGSQATIQSFHVFFQKLGVEDFISIRKMNVHLKTKDLSASPWHELSEMWPKSETEYFVEDYYSDELVGLIRKNRYMDSFTDQMLNLFIHIDKQWDSKFVRYCTSVVKNKEGNFIGETESSFSILLHTSSWLPAVETHSEPSADGFVQQKRCTLMKKPADLYVRSEVTERLLSDKVLYLDVKQITESFQKFLRLKTKTFVTKETVTGYLLQWSERSSPDVPAVFCTSLQHIKHIYHYLSLELTRHEFQDLLREKPIYFVPNKSSAHFMKTSEVCAGQMLGRNEIWLADKSGLFHRYRNLLEEFHSDICHKRTIASFYNDRPDLVEIFRQEGNVEVQPKVEEYIELLGLLCTTTTPKDSRILSDVLFIFSIIGYALASLPDSMPDEQTANMALESFKSTIKKLLWKQKVFPTKKQTWVSLEEHPMIADNREWEKMFANKDGVHFLDLEDKNKVTSKLQNSNTECHVQPNMILVVLDTCEIKRLSEVVEIRTAPDLIQPCLLMQNYFHQIIPIVQQYILARFSNVYQLLVQKNTQGMLHTAQFYQASKLEVTYQLTNISKDTLEVREEKCVIEPPTFYFQRNHLSFTGEINREVARHFSCGDINCNNSLRSFLCEVHSIVFGIAGDTMLDLLRRHDADGIEIAQEDRWQVTAPMLQLPEPEPAPELLELTFDNQNRNMFTPDQGSVSNQGSFEIRAWPPVSNASRNIVREKHFHPSSNIWPPPQSRDYMRSVRDLPSNIRWHASGDRGETTDGEKSDNSENKESKLDHKSASDLIPGDRDHDSRLKGSTVSGISHRQYSSRTPISSQPVTSVQIGVEQQSVKLTGQSGHDDVSESGVAKGLVIVDVKNDASSGQAPNVDNGQRINHSDGLSLEQDVNRQRELSALDKIQDKELAVNASEGRDIFSEGHGISSEGYGVSSEGQDISSEGHGVSAEGQGISSEGQGISSEGHGILSESQGILSAGHGISSDGHDYIKNKREEPKWTQMASEYTFDDLELNHDLSVPVTLNLKNIGDPEIGRWGEALVAEYLNFQKEKRNIADFTWKNKCTESGCPYDFEMEFNDKHVEYIEVKSTIADDKEVFEISAQQIKFACEKKDRFHIYRVFNVGNIERVKLIRINNLDLRLFEKQVKLCMLI